MPNVIPVPTGIKYILEGKYPDFIKNHGIFKRMNKINKVFPSLGLPNMSEDIAWSGETATQTAKDLLLYNVRDGIGIAINNGAGSLELRDVSTIFHNHLYSYNALMVKEQDGKIVLRLDRDITYAEKVIFKKDEGVFRVYNKLKEQWAAVNVAMPPLEEMLMFKTFSSANIPNKKYQIVFSSTGEQGAWDIATISMRGISSCQAWVAPNAKGLIGSISSQFVGVLYLTDGADFGGYGTRMIRRSLVRFGIHHQTKKPALFIDRVYPAALTDTYAMDLFKNFLAKKTGLPIISPNDPLWGQYYMPQSYIYNKYPLGQGEYTYMDAQIKKKAEFATAAASILSWNNSIITKMRRKLSERLKIQYDRYVFDKKTDKHLFKGGTANLVAFLHKRIGSMEGAYFIPGGSLLGEIGITPPRISDFSSQNEYHRSYIRTMFLHMEKIKNYQLAWVRRGNWYKDFPKSSEKLFNHLWKEYKQLLVEEYKACGSS